MNKALGLVTIALLFSACSDTTKPIDGGASGDALMCPAGYRPYYAIPGCDGTSTAVCAMNDDGCFGIEVCTCAGQTSRLCSWLTEPFRHYGACGTDGGLERPRN